LQLAVSYEDLLVHLTSLTEFPKFSIEWFTSGKFDDFRNFSQEIFGPFVHVSKFSEFLLDWKVPRFYQQNILLRSVILPGLVSLLNYTKNTAAYQGKAPNFMRAE